MFRSVRFVTVASRRYHINISGKIELCFGDHNITNIITQRFHKVHSYNYHYCTKETDIHSIVHNNNTKRMSTNSSDIGLRQLFDDESSTYTYLLWDMDSKDAILIDPVDIQVDRDLKEVEEEGVKLIYGVNTHAHADHVTGTGLLKQKLPGLKSIISKSSGAMADQHIAHGDKITFGSRYVEVRATPGHTAGCVSYVTDDSKMVFTGDALLIHGCGRTDFQEGSADTLYDSVHSQLFTLPEDCVVYPAHDYKERTSSTIGDEKANNPRLGAGKTKSEFIDIMNNLNLSKPKKIDVAVPANMRCGVPDVE